MSQVEFIFMPKTDEKHKETAEIEHRVQLNKF